MGERNPWHRRYLTSMYLATGGVLALWFGWLAVALFSIGMVVMTVLAIRWNTTHNGGSGT